MISILFALGTLSFTSWVMTQQLRGTVHLQVHDTTAPALMLPSNMTLEATSSNGAPYAFNPAPSASDLVDGPVAVSCNATSHSTFPLGITAVTCTAHDAANDYGSATFTIKVSVAVANS